MWRYRLLAGSLAESNGSGGYLFLHRQRLLSFLATGTRGDPTARPYINLRPLLLRKGDIDLVDKIVGPHAAVSPLCIEVRQLDAPPQPHSQFFQTRPDVEHGCGPSQPCLGRLSEWHHLSLFRELVRP